MSRGRRQMLEVTTVQAIACRSPPVRRHRQRCNRRSHKEALLWLKCTSTGTRPPKSTPIAWLRHAHFKPDGEWPTAIAITHDIIRRSLPAASLRQLSSNPFSRRVCRHPPHDFDLDGAAGLGNHTAAGRKVSARRTGPSTRCHQHDCKEKSPSPVTVLPSSGQYFATLVWRDRCRV